MRLIDADKLNYCFVDKENFVEGFNCVLEEEIANAETVDAVPLKWLASWTKKYIEKTRSEVGVLSERAVTVAEAFNEMKHDWREENETD